VSFPHPRIPLDDFKPLTNLSWLFKRGQEREAIEVLCEVFDLPEEDAYIQHEIANIKHALAEESTVQSNRALFRKDKLHTRRRILLAYFGLFMNQMGGPSFTRRRASR
jgi:hypothetical protein